MDTRKAALVTGGMGEPGESICQRLHTEGFRVVTIYSPRNDNAQLWLQEQRASLPHRPCGKTVAASCGINGCIVLSSLSSELEIHCRTTAIFIELCAGFTAQFSSKPDSKPDIGSAGA